MALALVVGLAVATWVGVRGVLAFEHLRAARDAVSIAAVGTDDPSLAIHVLASAGTDTEAARALTSDPVWQLVSALPWVGPQLDAISRTVAAADDAFSRALSPLAGAAENLSPAALAPVGGTVDVRRLATIEPVATSAAAALRRASDDVAAIDRRPLLGAVGAAVDDAAALIGRASDDADALSRATRLLPRMLGADGQRSYLVLFQNNAEWRSLGGVVGAVAQIDTRDGRIALTTQASTADFVDMAGEEVGPLPDEVAAVFGTGPSRFIQNATQVPDFTVGAPIARAMWQRLHGTSVDGVIALDPVTLSYLLRATGPIVLPSGDELTADNAVSLLLDEVYRRYDDPRDQDAFFQSATAAVFEALADGRADAAEVIAAVGRAGAERRLLVWNADAADQAVLDGTPLQGRLTADSAARSTVGVYLNDGTGSKMDVYLRPSVETALCTPDVASVRVELRSDAPDPDSLPAYVTGNGVYGVPPGEALTGVYVYLPPGARVLDRRSTGDTASPVGFSGGTHDGREVVKWSVQLAPGQRAQLDLEFRLPSPSDVDAVMTPTRDPGEVPHTGTCPFPPA